MKMEQRECSETSAYKIQTPGNYLEESMQHSEQGESLKSRNAFQATPIHVNLKLSELISHLLHAYYNIPPISSSLIWLSLMISARESRVWETSSLCTSRYHSNLSTSSLVGSCVSLILLPLSVLKPRDSVRWQANLYLHMKVYALYS